MVHAYEVKPDLVLLGRADHRRAELGRNESVRTIGGDLGDLDITGYTVEEDQTVVHGGVLHTTLELDEEEAHTVASQVLKECYASIGLEAIH